MKPKKNGISNLKSLIRWLNVENTLLSKVLERNFLQHKKQQFLLYTKLSLKYTIQFAKKLKTNIKIVQTGSVVEVNELANECIRILIRAGVELSRIHVHRHFTQLITTLIACLSRLYLLIIKWKRSINAK